MRVPKVNVKGNILDGILMACIINHENIHFSTGKNMSLKVTTVTGVQEGTKKKNRNQENITRRIDGRQFLRRRTNGFKFLTLFYCNLMHIVIGMRNTITQLTLRAKRNRISILCILLDGFDIIYILSTQYILYSDSKRIMS